MKQLFDEDRRGQVGIGTLIVFIAMVLVAAIAAGVLINTAGFLQTQAEDTGTQSTEQVADNLNVITEVGEVNGSTVDSTDNITEVRVGVQPAAGADGINLAELTIQYISDDDFENLVVGGDNPTLNGSVAGDGASTQASGETDPSNVQAGLHNFSADSNSVDTVAFGIDVVTAENEDDIVMTDNADRYEIVINTTGQEADNTGLQNLGPLEEGTEVELTITTEVGAQTVAFLQVPDSLSGDDAGSTVNL